MRWTHVSLYWPFELVIHRLPVDSPHKGPVTQKFNSFVVASMDKLMKKIEWLVKWDALMLMWRPPNVLFYHIVIIAFYRKTRGRNIKQWSLWVAVKLGVLSQASCVVCNALRILQKSPLISERFLNANLAVVTCFLFVMRCITWPSYIVTVYYLFMITIYDYQTGPVAALVRVAVLDVCFQINFPCHKILRIFFLSYCWSHDVNQ